MTGYAECALEVLEHFQVDSFMVFGWSLGGHIPLEMMPLLSSRNSRLKMLGAIIVGTPPCMGAEQITQGFIMDGADAAHMQALGAEHLTVEQAEHFARGGYWEPFEEWQAKDVSRTDGRARAIMLNSVLTGKGSDQARLVQEEKEVLLAVVNGAEEPYVNLDYLDGLKWGNLWERKCFRLAGLRHAPFWEDPKQFESILARFLEACENGREGSNG